MLADGPPLCQVVPTPCGQGAGFANLPELLSQAGRPSLLEGSRDCPTRVDSRLTHSCLAGSPRHLHRRTGGRLVFRGISAC